MSLRYYMGPSGAGKSTKLYKEIIERSGVETKRNFWWSYLTSLLCKPRKRWFWHTQEGAL